MSRDTATDEEAPRGGQSSSHAPSEQAWVNREIQTSVEHASVESSVFVDSPVAVVAITTTTETCDNSSSREQQGMDWMCRCIWLMAILIIAGSIGVGILLVKTLDRSGVKKDPAASNSATVGSPHEDSSTLLPPREYYDLLYNHLLGVRHVQDLRDPSTPTYEALEWMAFQDGAAHQMLLSNDELDVPRMEQRFAIAVFFFSTAGAEFWNSEWLQVGRHECEFDAIKCATVAGTGTSRNDSSSSPQRLVVTSMELHQRSLLGDLPHELAWLTHLEHLDLHQNRLKGTLPAVLFQRLSELQYFDMSFNSLTGSLPADWSAMTSLHYVNAQGNAFTGSIPTALPLLSLEYLSLNLNAISGTIPLQEWNDQARLHDELLLSLQPEGSDEASEQQLNLTQGSVALKLLDLGDTQVGGTLSPLIGSTLSHLVSLGLYQAKVGGSLPSQIGQLVNLEKLSLASTLLTGSIPVQLWELSNLEWMVLAFTDVSGTFPSQVSNLSSLQVLNLVRTRLSGTLPAELGSLTHLEWLQLSDTRIDGSIPTELGQLSKLSRVWLHQTRLEGEFPNELCDIPSIHSDLRLSCSGIQCSCCNYCY